MVIPAGTKKKKKKKNEEGWRRIRGRRRNYHLSWPEVRLPLLKFLGDHNVTKSLKMSGLSKYDVQCQKTLRCCVELVVQKFIICVCVPVYLSFLQKEKNSAIKNPRRKYWLNKLTYLATESETRDLLESCGRLNGFFQFSASLLVIKCTDYWYIHELCIYKLLIQHHTSVFCGIDRRHSVIPKCWAPSRHRACCSSPWLLEIKEKNFS